MRDINRIPKILERLQQIWEKHPDLRLSQLLVNLQTFKNDDLYYKEDEAFIKMIEEFYEAGSDVPKL